MYGCRETDFKGDYAGKIAVLFRGACKFEKKIENAALKNATGVVVINNNPEGVITMSIGGNINAFVNLKYYISFYIMQFTYFIACIQFSALGYERVYIVGI